MLAVALSPEMEISVVLVAVVEPIVPAVVLQFVPSDGEPRARAAATLSNMSSVTVRSTSLNSIRTPAHPAQTAENPPQIPHEPTLADCRNIRKKSEVVISEKLTTVAEVWLEVVGPEFAPHVVVV